MKTFRQIVDVLECPPSVRQLAATLHVELPISLRKLLSVPLSKESLLSPLSDSTVYFTGGRVLAKADGTWEFSGALYDSAVFAGDKWAVGFIFANTKAGAVARGTLGADLSGPATTATFNLGGRDRWLTKNWGTVLSNPVIYKLRADDDPFQFFESLADTVEEGYIWLKEGWYDFWENVSFEDERGDRPPEQLTGPNSSSHPTD